MAVSMTVPCDLADGQICDRPPDFDLLLTDYCKGMMCAASSIEGLKCRVRYLFLVRRQGNSDVLVRYWCMLDCGLVEDVALLVSMVVILTVASHRMDWGDMPASAA